MKIIIELKSMQDAKFSIQFFINFAKMGFLGDDLAKIKPFDFPLIALKFTSPPEFKFTNEYYSTDPITFHLLKQNMLTYSPALEAQMLQIRKSNENSQRQQPFTMQEFCLKMSQLIIKINTYKNSKKSIQSQKQEIHERISSFDTVHSTAA